MPRRLAGFLIAPLWALSLGALAADITALRSWRAPDNTRLVLDLSAPVQYRISHESTPARLVLEIDDSVSKIELLRLPANIGAVKSSRFEQQGAQARLILELATEAQPKVFQLAPNEQYGNRLVLDLFDRPPAATPEPLPPPEPSSLLSATPQPTPLPPVLNTPATPPVAAAQSQSQSQSLPTPPASPLVVPPAVAQEKTVPELKPAAPVALEKPQGRNIIIAIDAGHGGEDPGALGMKGTYEKHVTLAIARELKAMFDAEPGIRAELTRTGDYFLPLPERRRLARNKYKADIFISIHADAAENRAARGASVFALSLKGAGSATSRFARMLAERENRADLIGGATLERDDDVLRNVLADMVVAGSLEHSLHMGRHILGELGPVAGKLHSRNVEQAGFAVLKEPGMVSLLVETGFISNPAEEQKLIDKAHQRELARAVLEGTRRYLSQYPAPGTYFAWAADRRRASQAPRLAEHKARVENKAENKADSRAEAGKVIRYKVVPGDNLTRLAERYETTLADIRELNRLADDNVRIGQVIRIPVN